MAKDGLEGAASKVGAPLKKAQMRVDKNFIVPGPVPDVCSKGLCV